MLNLESKSTFSIPVHEFDAKLEIEISKLQCREMLTLQFHEELQEISINKE